MASKGLLNLKQAFQLILAILLAALTIESGSGNEKLHSFHIALSINSCSSSFAKLFEWIRSKNPNAHIWSESPLSNLHPITQKWLKMRQTSLGTADYKNMMALGKIVRINKTNCKIVARLGRGGEADVYLVETPGGLRSLKVFRNRLGPLGIEANIQETRRVGAAIQMPKIYEIDLRRGMLLLEYVEGVPLTDIRLHGADLGLTASQQQQIEQRWYEQQYAMERSCDGLCLEGNAIYSFTTDEIRMFDPR